MKRKEEIQEAINALYGKLKAYEEKEFWKPPLKDHYSFLSHAIVVLSWTLEVPSPHGSQLAEDWWRHQPDPNELIELLERKE